MILTHCGVTYECATAVKCTSDNYIKLYDASGAEIASFNNISDFSDYELSGGSFSAPCGGGHPIQLTAYTIGGRTIGSGAWTINGNEYTYEIEHNLISANKATCNVFLLFAPGTELEYTATQESGKVVLHAVEVPLSDVVIESIQICRT